METCYFCSCDSTSMNKCPKCKKNFCSLKCYKCQKHYCSEQFYKEWVDLVNGTKKEKPVIMPFEEYMKYEDAKAEKVDMPIDVDEAEADNIDSDDDDLSYIDNVIKDATEDFSKLSMADIDAQLTSKGVNILDGDEESSMNELFSKLTCEEQKAFNRLNIMLRLMFSRSFSMAKNDLVTTKKTDIVSSLISQELTDKFTKLFAVVYVGGRQFKVSQNDLIVLDNNQPIEIGDKITLEKILAIGGKDFTILGRPLLDKSKVYVNATVVEKNISSPEVDYTKYDGHNVKHLKWLSREQTTLRINTIFVDPSITEE